MIWVFLSLVWISLSFLLWKVWPLCEKLLQLQARKLEKELAPREPQPKAPEPIPADLLGYIAKYDAEWARDQGLERCYELYSKLGSWDRVRTAIALADGAEIQETT